MSMAARADVFLDRDGVLIRNRPDYVKGWDEVEVLPGALDAVSRLHRAGHRVIVVTNQSAVGRGLMDMEDVDAIHERLDQLVRTRGGEIAAWLVCPHLPWAGCECRKPRPGLFHQAREALSADLTTAYVVGDQASDVAAARSVGSRPILVEQDQPRGPSSIPALGDGCPVAPDLAHAADVILASDR